MSVSSFDFDKFSLSSEDNTDFEENNIINTIEKDYIYNTDMDGQINIDEQINNSNKKFKQTKDNNANVFLNILDTYIKSISTPEHEKIIKFINLKYMMTIGNISNIIIPKYILYCKTHTACANCEVNIEQRIGDSFMKILKKDYFLCFYCKHKFFNNIDCVIKKKFLKMKEENKFFLSVEQQVEEFNKFNKLIELHNYKNSKNILNKFGYFLENFMSDDEVKIIMEDIIKIAYDTIKINKPYANKKIFDFDMSYFRYTNMKRIKSLLKSDVISKIDDENYKFVKNEFGNHYEHRASASNKCICCETEFNLIKFKPAFAYNNVKINYIIHKYDNIHYLLYASCTNCIKLCNKIQTDCIHYFTELYKLNNLHEVINVENEKNNIINFFKIYDDKFFLLLNNSKKNNS